MNWYLAKLIFQVRSGEGTHTPQFDEQWRFIRADEADWAFEKAMVIGRLEETNFLNDQEENVSWTFIAVSDIIRIGSIEDGAQVISNTEEPANTTLYIESIKIKQQKSLALARRSENLNINQMV